MRTASSGLQGIKSPSTQGANGNIPPPASVKARTSGVPPGPTGIRRALGMEEPVDRYLTESVSGERCPEVLGDGTSRLLCLLGLSHQGDRSAHTDRTSEEPTCPGHGEKEGGRHSSGGLSRHRHRCRISAEDLDVALHPFQGGQPVEDAAVDAAI